MKHLDTRQIWQEYAEQLEGMQHEQQIRVNHSECEAGTDSRQRLYIKRTPTAWILYCHNCAKSGRVLDKTTHTAKRRLQAAPEALSGEISLPQYISYSSKEWPLTAQLWLSEAIDPDTATAYGIGYDVNGERLVLPFFSGDTLLGYQARRVHHSDSGPKYLTYRRKDVPAHNIVVNDGAKVVIVEDILSSIKVAEAGYTGLALLSSNMGDDLLAILSNIGDIPGVAVWLDNDNHQVRDNQRSLTKRLSLLYAVEVIRTAKDPKKHSIEEIRNILQ